MSLRAPDIDSRNGADVIEQVVALAKIYVPDLKIEFDPNTNMPTGLSGAIIGSFARFCEIIIQRLNRVPEKNFLAFFDMLGASLQPPQPARVPLTFFSAAGNTNVAVVPAGTRAAAPPLQGEKDPVIFETETDLVVSPAKLTNVFVRNPLNDRYSDISAVLGSADADLEIFEGTIANEHILYIGNKLLFGLPNITNATIKFEFETIQSPHDSRKVVWENLDGTSLTLAVDTTANLTQSGAVSFSYLEPIDLSLLDGIAIESRWIRCRFLTPVTSDSAGKKGMVSESLIPKIKSITLNVTVGVSGLLPQNAAGTVAPLDLTSPFYPFGERPKFGDTFYLACDKAFSLDNNTVGITINIVNPTGSSISNPKPVKASSDLTLMWEYWNGSSWRNLNVNDGTTNFSKTGMVTFTIPAATGTIPAPASKMIAGIESYWIRVRIETGNYGNEASYTPDNSSPSGYKFNPADFMPPIVKDISINYSTTITSVMIDIVSKNDFSMIDISKSLKNNSSQQPFCAMADLRPTLYAGFSLPTALKNFPNQPISFYLRMVEPKYGEKNPPQTSSATTEPLQVFWEYWNGSGWAGLSVRDGTNNLTSSGIIELLPPADFTNHPEFNVDAFWIRAVWKTGVYSTDPRLNHILLNTVMASQTVTIRNEILGSSDQSETQNFKTSYSPVLIGQKLMIRETEMPSGQDLAVIQKEEGNDAVITINDDKGKLREIWVCWHEVNDFYGSGPRSRHYCFDHLTGNLTFGNNINGMIPPQGSGNIKMAVYKTGGGEHGNRVASTISQLKTTLPYIEKVINTEASDGGVEAQTIDSLIEQAPRTLRHGNRSVALEDYEDLAMRASYGVARAKCIPVMDLKNDPYTETITPGLVCVIIVPRTTEIKPTPTLELVDRVRNYLLDYCIPTADVQVVGALYLQVDIEVNIAISTLEGANTLQAQVIDTLVAFLHPLTGDFDGKGWEFGRQPHDSDIYALLEPIPGIDHVISLSITSGADFLKAGKPEMVDKIKNTGRFLVYSGDHTVNMTLK